LTAEQFERVAQLVVEIARNDPSGDDLVTVCLAAMHMLPENVRSREQRLAIHMCRYVCQE
jgi:hypothetical protein